MIIFIILFVIIAAVIVIGGFTYLIYWIITRKKHSIKLVKQSLIKSTLKNDINENKEHIREIVTKKRILEYVKDKDPVDIKLMNDIFIELQQTHISSFNKNDINTFQTMLELVHYSIDVLQYKGSKQIYISYKQLLDQIYKDLDAPIPKQYLDGAVVNYIISKYGF